MRGNVGIFTKIDLLFNFLEKLFIYRTKVCVKINDAYYSFAYCFFIFASIIPVFGRITGTVFVYPRKIKKNRNDHFRQTKRGIKVLEPLKT